MGEERCVLYGSREMSLKKQKSPFMRKIPEEPTTTRSPRELPVSTALQQCCHIIQLQDILLQNTLKHRKELIDAKRSERYEYDKVCKQLEVKYSYPLGAVAQYLSFSCVLTFDLSGREGSTC